jgi:hypothetical protein
MTTKRIPVNTNEAIVSFYNKTLTTDDQRFQMTDLVNYIQPLGFGTTAGTIERSLRSMRKAEKLNYEVVNHKQSIFKALPVDKQAAQEQSQVQG